MLISLVTGNDLFERLNPAEEPLYCTALLVEFWIKPEWSPSFPVVLANFPGIVGCICGDDRRTILYFGNLKCFDGRLVEPGIIGICRCNGSGKGEAIPINQRTQFLPSNLFIAVVSRLFSFFGWDTLRIRSTAREIDLLDLVLGSEQLEEDRLVHAFLR